ncbi:MAG TPA: fumarylacetoacetate hydrolase family protein [Vicinamibacterales bacterium]|nr:fumarylacetoacetate hydrolase family protein [Vicinamibacterales bacterium]
MRHIQVIAAALILVASAGPLPAQSGLGVSSAQPFKLGTFEIDGEERVGIVLQDKVVLDLEAANRALERNPAYPRVPMPETMLDLIGQYEYGLKFRLYEIVNDTVAGNRLGASPRPRYIHDVAQVRTLAPIRYPGKMLMTAVNFFSHVGEGSAGAEEQKKQVAARRANRGVPYMFIKPTQGVIIGNGDDIVLPHGRDRIDWEVELGTIIGRAAKYVPASKAAEHIFGYTVILDISDRGGRPPGGFSSGSDWFVGKGHDNFGPMGPWIVPKEFYGDPMKNLRQTLSVGTEKMQDATAGDMIHSLYEVIEYASSIVTLYPGDVIGAGTSGGVGMGTTVRGAQLFLKPGDKIVAVIDGIGTLTMPVVAEPAPAPGTGSYLPAVSSYRK